MPSTREPSDIVNLKLRLREDLRAALEKEAKDKGASLNSEIVSVLSARTEFIKRRLLEELYLGGGHNARIVRGISALLMYANPQNDWFEDPCDRIAVRLSLNMLLDQLVPMPSPDEYDQGEAGARSASMINLVLAYLKRVEGGRPVRQLKNWIQRTKTS